MPPFGRIAEIPTPAGLAYLQLLRRDPEYGDLVRVLPGLFDVRPAAPGDLAELAERFVAFFPFSAALRTGLIAAVGEAPLPPGAWKQRPMRRAGARSRDGRVQNWIITENGRERFVEHLSESERKLSIAAIVNDTLLAERIANGWTPEQEI
jgi:hypothetical protein